MISSETIWPKLAIATAALPLLMLSACAPAQPETVPSGSSTSADATCIPDGQFDPSEDYFPDKAEFEYATGVSVEYHNSYKVVTIARGAAESDTPVSYVLVQCGAPAPELSGDLAGAQQITVPIKRAALGSTTDPIKFTTLDSLDAIAGLTNGKKIWDEQVRDKVQSGDIAEFGSGDGTTEINTENLIAIQPDMYLISGHYAPSKFQKIQEAGIPVVASPDWLETTPLGRTEYLKYVALFLDKESTANEKFDAIAQRYNAIKEKAANVSERPMVINSFQSKGTWFVKSNNNYSVQFLRDAGADYAFSDVTGVASAKYDTEQVLAQAADADFWIDGGLYGAFSSVAQAVASDSRLSEIKAVRQGNLWNATIQTDPDLGNNYWQKGIMEPDLVLGDLIAIFHPDLEPDHEFAYYQKSPTE